MRPDYLLVPLFLAIGSLALAQPAPRDAKRSDQCSKAKPRFDFNPAAAPLKHEFECWQTEFKPSFGVDFHEGWSLQYIRGLHSTSCPGGIAACDIDLVRMCHKSKVAGMPAPCMGRNNPNPIGSKGCAVCESSVTPHPVTP